MIITIVLAAVVFTLRAASLGIFIYLTATNRKYNIIEHAVSDYAVGSAKRLTTVATWSTAVMWLLLAVLLWHSFSQWENSTAIIIQLLVLMLVFIALPFFPTDIEGEQPTLIGRIHLVLAVVWFALAYTCSGLFLPHFNAGFGTALHVTRVVMAISLTALCIALIIKPLRRYAFGLSERAFLLSVHVFYLLVPIGLVLIASSGICGVASCAS